MHRESKRGQFSIDALEFALILPPAVQNTMRCRCFGAVPPPDVRFRRDIFERNVRFCDILPGTESKARQCLTGCNGKALHGTDYIRALSARYDNLDVVERRPRTGTPATGVSCPESSPS